MARVVVLDWKETGPPRDAVDLRDETTKGDWRKWVADRIGIALDEDEDIFSSPTAVPGVSLVTNWSFDREGVNVVSRRILYQGPAEPRFETSYPVGPAVALVHTDDFGGSLLNLSGPQRVAIELAAYGETDPFRRCVARIEQSRRPPGQASGTP